MIEMTPRPDKLQLRELKQSVRLALDWIGGGH